MYIDASHVLRVDDRCSVLSSNLLSTSITIIIYLNGPRHFSDNVSNDTLNVLSFRVELRKSAFTFTDRCQVKIIYRS